MCCSVLQIHVDILQVSDAVRSKSVLRALQRVAVCRRYSKTPSGTVRSQGVLQCVAVRCSVRCVCCSVLPCVVDSPRYHAIARCCEK